MIIYKNHLGFFTLHFYFNFLTNYYDFSIIKVGDDMKKITILALHMGYGGIENAVATLANTLVDKYEVEILSVYRLYKDPIYELDERVNVRFISNIKPNKNEMKYYLKKKNFNMFFKGIGSSIKTGYVKYIKTALELKKLDTDVLITTRDVHNYLSGKYASSSIKKIAWEHNHHNDNKKYIKRLCSSCKNVDYFIAVSKELEAFYKSYLGKKVFYIPNSLDRFPNKVSKLESNNLTAIGRLSKEKGLDDLLRIFKKISLKDSNLKLNIIGDGPQKDNLLDLAKSLKLGDKVIFHGFQNKDYINDVLQDSMLYLMTSHTESFGLVLIEAMSNGVPCVAFDSAQGANEIISDGVNGYLIKDRNQDDFVSKVIELTENKTLRKKIGKNARESSKEYSSSVSLEKWSKIINKRK